MDLRAKALDFGVDLSVEQERLLRLHLDLLKRKNEVVNLTRIVDDEDALVLHVLDSLAFVPFVAQTEGRVLDIGTGGGFPGLPIAVTCERDVLCIDSVGKKTDAVQSFADEMGLTNCKTEHIRAEELALREPESFGCVVARAVDKLSTLFEYAAPLLCNEGMVVISKGNLGADEMNAGSKAAEICGLEIVAHREFDLPDGYGHREVIVGKRSQRPAIALPRQNGKAHRVPLGY